MQKEAVFLDEMLDLNPKNYQLWNYRRRFALKRGNSFEDEVRLTTAHFCCFVCVTVEMLCAYEFHVSIEYTQKID